uniref:Metallo-beta-lactamase domain-containing protein n=1 Tax=Panagrolaimus sp. JU765 TaxID=591449 RepID=A0AC34RKJ2_9BILA
MNTSKLIFRQLFEPISCTWTYLLGCSTTKNAVIIDPVLETIERDYKIIKQLNLNLIYGLNTHVHADHVTSTGELKNIFPKMKSILSILTNDSKADIYVDENDIINFGKNYLKILQTPGHTNGCISYINHDYKMIFTGDALLIRGCGRTDFQEGNPRTLYRSIHDKIFTLPDDYLIYPGHDYTGQTVSSVGEEKQFNQRLIVDENEFVEIMKNLNLPYPKQIDKAVPANKVCGIQEMMDEKLKEMVFGKKK